MANTRNCKFRRDFISSLPDEILLIILSKLNIKEQASTSVLSSRWTNLWTFNSCLNIDAKDFIQWWPWWEDIWEKTMKFTNTVDQILRKHQGQVIDRLEITYPDQTCVIPSQADSWIEIAKLKQVRVLHLDFKSRYFVQIKDKAQRFSLGSTTFSSLVTLYLEKAYLSDSAVHDLLSRSPNLLELSIIRSGKFQRLNIGGSSLKLERLELLGNNVRFLDICAPTLVSFSFSTGLLLPTPKRICFNNTPLLTQLSCPLELILDDWCNFYPLLPQIATLTLTLSENIVEYIGSIPRKFPTLVNLEQMQVRLLSSDDSGRLLGLFSGLLRASPSLLSLSLDLAPLEHNNFTKIDKFPDHTFLKEVERNKSKRFEYEVQLLTCIVESCSLLEKIIIHSDSYKTKVEQKRVESAVKKLVAQKELKIVFKATNINNGF